MYETEDENIAGQSVPGWAVYQCSSCKRPVCARAPLAHSRDFGTARSKLVNQKPPAATIMPKSQHDFSDWPERAANYMKQAVDSLAMPDGAVMLAGSAVDAMLKAKGLENGSVYSRIEEAVTQNLLTTGMGEWAHSVRLAANSPRHADLHSPHATKEEAQATLDFVNALGQFLFVLPERVRRGRETAESLA